MKERKKKNGEKWRKKKTIRLRRKRIPSTNPPNSRSYTWNWDRLDQPTRFNSD